MKKSLMIALAALLFYCTACGNKKSCNDKLCGRPNGTDTATLTCKLTNAEQAAREEKLRTTVFSKYEKMHEMPDGFEFVYANGKQYAPILLDFIVTERECCPFFTFNLTFEPNSDKVVLTIGGSPKIKEILKKMIKK